MLRSKKQGSVLIIVMVFLLLLSIIYAHMCKQAAMSGELAQHFIFKLTDKEISHDESY